MIHGIIYKYTNKVNGKVYVGQTTNPEKRYNQHRNTCEDSYFHRAIKKYGFENFEYEVLATVITSDTDKNFVSATLDYLEITYIQIFDSFNNGYNLTIGGGGNRRYNTEEERKEAKKKYNREFRKKYYRKNINKEKEYQKNYREEHKERINKHNRELAKKYNKIKREGKINQITNPIKREAYLNNPITKELNMNLVMSMVDENLTLTENLKIINENGWNICEKTLRNYYDENGLKADNRKLTDEDAVSLIDYSLSARKNYIHIKELGHKIGNKRFFQLYKDNKN